MVSEVIGQERERERHMGITEVYATRTGCRSTSPETVGVLHRTYMVNPELEFRPASQAQTGREAVRERMRKE